MDARKFQTGNISAAVVKAWSEEQRLLTIAAVGSKTFEGENIPTGILLFEETGKYLTLTPSRLNSVIDQFGVDTDKWKGAKVKLNLGKAAYNNKSVDSVMIERA